MSKRYAVVVASETIDGKEWIKVIDALQKKYNARVFTYNRDIDEVKDEVNKYLPRYICVVTKPDVDFRKLVLAANKFCRSLDEDPYVDAIWGILTGWDADQVLELLETKPLLIRCAFMKTALGWLSWFKEGLFLTEDSKRRGHKAIKQQGEALVQSNDGPKNDSEDLEAVAKEFNSNKYDLIIGSGHGNSNEWMLMYPHGPGYIRARDAELIAEGVGPQIKIKANNPKIYWAVGNCLTGLINGRGASYKNSFVLAWIRNGVKQYIGAIDGSYYGTNWYMSDYFFNQQGRWTFAESLFLLRQSTWYEIQNKLEGKDAKYTDGIFVLYGDPAFEARIDPDCKPDLDEQLEVKEIDQKKVYQFKYTVKINATNGRCCGKYKGGWRIYATLLPFAIKDVQERKSDFDKVVFTKHAIIWDSGEPLKTGDKCELLFTATRALTED